MGKTLLSRPSVNGSEIVIKIHILARFFFDFKKKTQGPIKGPLLLIGPSEKIEAL